MASHSYASSCKVTRQCHSNTFVHPSASRNVFLYSFVSRTLKVLKLPHWPLLNLRFQWLIFPHRGAWFQATIAVTIVGCWPVHVYGQPLWMKAIDENIFLIFIFSMNKLLSVVTSLEEEFTWAIWTCYWYLSHNTHPPPPPSPPLPISPSPHLPSLTTDCCLVGIVIKRTFETSQRVCSRVKRKNANGQFSVVL